MVELSTGVLVVAGGRTYEDDGTHVILSDVWRSHDGVIWNQASVDELPPRFSHSMVVLSDDTIVLMGGRHEDIYNTVYTSADAGTSWSEYPTPAWPARTAFGACVLADDTIVVAGGARWSQKYNDVWYSTSGGLAWSVATAEAAWSRRLHFGIAVVPHSDGLGTGVLVVVGGKSHDGRWLSDVWRDGGDRGATWTLVGVAAWPGRISMALFVAPGPRLVVVGGCSPYYHSVGDMWVSGTDFSTWTEVPTQDWKTVSWDCQQAPIVRSDGSIIFSSGGTAMTAVYQGTIPGLVWSSAECSSLHPAMCRAPPESTPISVSLPALTLESGVVPDTAPSREVLVQHAPITPKLVPRTPTVAHTAVVDITWSVHVSGVVADDFTVAITGGGVETGRRLHSVVDSSDMVLEVDVTNDGDRAATPCPAGYTSSGPVRTLSGLDDIMCGRVVEEPLNRADANAACAPFSLATIESEAALAFFTGLRGVPMEQYWYVRAHVCATALL